MSKSSKKLDRVMASECGKALSPFMLTYKHVKLLNATGQRFVFAYVQDGQVYYDVAEVVSLVNGCRRKPETFILNDVVKERLNAKFYNRWYFEDVDYLYPLQTCKSTTLFDEFLWTRSTLPTHSDVVIDPEVMCLRKKPLLAQREKPVRWEDVLPTPLTPPCIPEDVRWAALA